VKFNCQVVILVLKSFNYSYLGGLTATFLFRFPLEAVAS